jgi:starch synthase
MDILMVAAELGPWVRETDAADAVASLAKALRQLGHGVSVAVPRYPGFEAGGLMLARRLTPLPLPGGGEVSVLDGQLPTGAQLILFDAPVLYDRPGAYGEAGEDYPDNAKRFGLLSQAAAALVRQRAQQGQAYDVVHVHDYPAALVPMALRRLPGPAVPTILTIHDGARQGSFPQAQIEALGMPRDTETDEGVLLDGRINLLKAGLMFADAVTTVSPTDALELSSPERSGPLAKVFAEAPKEVIGIVNGVDYATYNPATDTHLVSRYDAEDTSNKARSKTQLLREQDLELELDRPLVCTFGPLTKQKGADILVAALPHVLRHDLAMVVLGPAPEPALLAKIAAGGEQHKERFALIEAPNDGQVHRAFAAADMVLTPSRHEPCGVTQLVAQRYGALPVAHATGGILDTIVDADAALETGTGFLFDELSPGGLIGALERALAAYASEGWPRLQRRVMRLDLGWDRPARRYLQIYRHSLASAS